MTIRPLCSQERSRCVVPLGHCGNLSIEADTRALFAPLFSNTSHCERSERLFCETQLRKVQVWRWLMPWAVAPEEHQCLTLAKAEIVSINISAQLILSPGQILCRQLYVKQLSWIATEISHYCFMLLSSEAILKQHHRLMELDGIQPLRQTSLAASHSMCDISLVICYQTTVALITLPIPTFLSYIFHMSSLYLGLGQIITICVYFWLDLAHLGQQQKTGCYSR